ncbi:hypothetical protein AB4Z22_36905, partial [Paenibacillus sp. TAF58]
RRLANDRRYACRILNAINTQNKARLLRIVREQVKSPYLKSVTGAKNSELRLHFRFPNGSSYENSFFGG